MKELLDSNYNVLFITLDSCRFDTYELANTPTLDQIGKARLAQTVGNFTYSAHSGFFIGHLPTVRDGSRDDFFTKDGKFLWKVSAASVKRDAGVQLEGFTIQQGYRQKGYSVIGFGGTTFFEHSRSELRRDYGSNEFTYFGNSITPTPRLPETLPLHNVNRIVDSVERYDKWFVFINETATHGPYNIDPVNEELEEIIRYSADFKAGRIDPERRFNYDNAGYKLHQLQVKALEYVDMQLNALLDGLPNDKPLLVVICGDHGETFGENGYWGHLHNAPEVLNVPLIINPSYVHT